MKFPRHNKPKAKRKNISCMSFCLAFFPTFLTIFVLNIENHQQQNLIKEEKTNKQIQKH